MGLVNFGGYGGGVQSTVGPTTEKVPTIGTRRVNPSRVLFDALYEAAKVLEKRPPDRRRIIFIISDGVELGHADVGDDNVRLAPLVTFDSLGHRSGGQYVGAVLFQDEAQHFTGVFVIIDDEDGAAGKPVMCAHASILMRSLVFLSQGKTSAASSRFSTRAVEFSCHLSGCHLNPAVSVGLAAARRFPAAELPAYIVSQVLGGIAEAAALYAIASGKPGFDITSGLASNGYGLHSPGGYSMMAGFFAETLLTFFFLMIILGATDRRAPQGLAPIAIGFALTLIHLIGIPVTNLSVNPARSTGPAVMVGGWALQQLWLFWVSPIAGSVLAASAYSMVSAQELQPVGSVKTMAAAQSSKSAS